MVGDLLMLLLLVRVCYVQSGQNCGLGTLHGLGIGIALMVVADKMQDTMDDKMCSVIARTDRLLPRLADHRLGG